MNDAEPVRLLERIGNLNRHAHRLTDRERTSVETVDQCLAFHQFHDDEQCAVILADVVGGGDGGRPEQRRGPRFLEQAFPSVGVLVVVGGDELQRDRATEPRVPRSVDFTHAATAQTGADLVVLHDAADGGDGVGVGGE